MTVTDQERKARMGEQGSSTSDVQIDDPRAAHKAGQKAFKELTAPIRGSMALAQQLSDGLELRALHCRERSAVEVKSRNRFE